MSNESKELKKRKELEKDQGVLANFVGFYCRSLHGRQQSFASRILALGGEGELRKIPLCNSCHELLRYALERRQRCPLDPKPSCKHCPVHCYAPARRAEIRELMRYSGMRLLLRGRLDLLWHYFF